jgi:DNA helicase-2/ATP-dependent DNA helicase PcrA
MDILYLSGAACRTVYGSPQWKAPSRFLSEIPKDMIQVTGKAARIVATEGGLYEVKDKKSKDFDELKDPEWDDDPVMAPYAMGDTVRHKQFGKGMVLSLSGSGDNLKVTVSFPNHGKKQLLAKIAKLEKVE